MADGSFAIVVETMGSARISHATGHALFRTLHPSQLRARPTPAGTGLRIPLTMLVAKLSRLADADRPDDLIGRMKAVGTGRSAGAPTWGDVLFGEIDASCPADLPPPPRGAGHSLVTEPCDDLMIRHLAGRLGIRRIRPTAPTVEGLHGSDEDAARMDGDPGPRVRYVGLPDAMPGFSVVPAVLGRPSCVEVRFGRSRAGDREQPRYRSIGGSPSLIVQDLLPEATLSLLPGRPATDLVGLDALSGWTLGERFDAWPQGTAFAVFPSGDVPAANPHAMAGEES